MRWQIAFRQSPDGVLHSNGEVCCILGVCCPPLQASEALTAEFVKLGVSALYAEKCARYVLDGYDLAPHGTLGPLKAALVKMARKHALDHGDA